jgi:hypothetical protein
MEAISFSAALVFRRLLRSHNGLTAMFCELMTHLPFYSGWPNVGSGALIAKQVFGERGV